MGLSQPRLGPIYIYRQLRHVNSVRYAHVNIGCSAALNTDPPDFICMAPFYQGMDLPEIFNQLKKRLRYEKGKTTVGAEHNTQIQTQNYKEINMTVQGDLHVHGDYIESGATKNVTTTIEHVDNYHAHPVAATHNETAIPPKNNYQFLIHWLEEQKEQGNDYLQQAGGNRALMCRNLSQLFDWTVDSNSLGKAYAQKVR